MTAILKEVIRNTLDNLTGADFKRFKHYLRDQGQFAWGKLERADPDDTVDLMVQVHNMGAGGVMLTILKKMNHNQLAMDLEKDLAKRCEGEQGDPSPKKYVKIKFSSVGLHQDSGDYNVQDIYTELYIVEGCTEGVNMNKPLELSKCKTTAEDLEEFELKKHLRSEEGLKKMLHKVEVSRRVWLNQCNLSKASCEIMASVLQESFHLRELDMSGNDLQDEGVELLRVGLKVPQCKLETLRLCGCLVSHKGCSFLASALKSNPSHLKHLDLSYNHPGDSGIRELIIRLNDLNCKLQTLRLNQCHLSKASCEMMALVLQRTPSHLRELDMSNNDLQDEGVELLCAGLKHPQCKLETLRLSQCHLSKASCESMASVLQGKPSHLRELDMSVNDLQDEGVELLCVGLGDPQCKLETLRLSGCMISQKGCSCLTSALKSNPNYLKELDLSYNHPGDSGVTELSDRQNDPNCKLETFRYDNAGETRMKPGPRKYACEAELTLSPKTTHRHLSLSEEGKKVTWETEEQPYPDHPDRFDYWVQVLSGGGLSGRCYWEVEWSGDAAEIAVAYKSIQRKGEHYDSGFGRNAKSWRLNCSRTSYSAWHNNKKTAIPAPSSGSRRVGVYLDQPAGTLSYYSVSSDTLTLLHTFHSMFADTELLYPGFGFEYCVSNSSVSLCQIT